MSKKKPQLTHLERKALQELLTQQTTRIGTRKSENKGFSDTPLFLRKEKGLFD